MLLLLSLLFFYYFMQRTCKGTLNGEDASICVTCNCHPTVEYILIECGEFAEVNERRAENSRQLFQENLTEVCDFLHDI